MSSASLRQPVADALSLFAAGPSDLEYLFPIGWSELEGIANRGDFDLTAHMQHSGTKLEWVGQDGERYTPPGIEPAGGGNRGLPPSLEPFHQPMIIEGIIDPAQTVPARFDGPFPG